MRRRPVPPHHLPGHQQHQEGGAGHHLPSLHLLAAVGRQPHRLRPGFQGPGRAQRVQRPSLPQWVLPPCSKCRPFSSESFPHWVPIL